MLNWFEIRPEALTDQSAIGLVIKAAFRDHPHSDQTEHLVVARLREAGALTLSLVASAGEALIGYVAISPVTIEGRVGGWYGLGPLAVDPPWQGQGIGSALVREALARLQAQGVAGCVVYGSPRYYGRFGFRSLPGLRLPGFSADHFLALSFDSALPCGTVRYHSSFGL